MRKLEYAGEIDYVYETLQSQQLPWNGEDFKLSNTIATYRTNFANAETKTVEDCRTRAKLSDNTSVTGGQVSTPEKQRARYPPARCGSKNQFQAATSYWQQIT